MTMTVETTTFENKNISQVLKECIEKAKLQYGQAKKYVIEAYNQAIKEGFTPDEAKKLLLLEIKELSSHTIYRYLPDLSKDAIKQKAAQSPRLPLAVASGTTVVEGEGEGEGEGSKTIIDLNIPPYASEAEAEVEAEPVSDTSNLIPPTDAKIRKFTISSMILSRAISFSKSLGLGYVTFELKNNELSISLPK